MFRLTNLVPALLLGAVALLQGGSAAAQGPAYAGVSDSHLEQILRTLDPRVEMKVNPDGSRGYYLTVHRRTDGSRMDLVVMANERQVTVFALLSEPLPLNPGALPNLNANLARIAAQLNLGSIQLGALEIGSGKVVIYAKATIDRSGTPEAFCDELARFLVTSFDLNGKFSPK